jgi:PAS domain S-box-containing protein
MYYQKGTMPGLNISTHDASSSEEQLFVSHREKEQKQNQVLENLAMAIYTCDPNGHIEFYNKAAAELWGRKPEIGKEIWSGCWKMFEPDGITVLPPDHCSMAIVLKELRVVRGEEMIIERPDGQRRIVQSYPDLIFDSSGVVAGAVNLLVDITPYKQKEVSESEGKYGQSAEAVYKNSIATPTDNSFHHLAFDYAFQANILSAISTGKIIRVNHAACKLLGYSKRELLSKNLAAIFDMNESSFKKMLDQSMAKGHSRAEVTVIKKGGKTISGEITSSVFTDKDGVEKSIATIADISQIILKQKSIDAKKEKIVANNIALAKAKQKEIDLKREKIITDNILQAKAKSDARLAANDEWIKYMGDTSYDVMWNWDIANDQIYVGNSIEEVLGYKLLQNIVTFTDFKRCLLPEERDRVEKELLKTLASRDKTWKDSYRFKRRDGSIASTISRANIVRDGKGKAIRLIGAIQDISRLQEAEKKLDDQITLKKENSDMFQLAAKLSFDGIWDWDILTNEFFLGEGFEELFGYTFNNTDKVAFDWSNYLHPEDKERVMKGLKEAIASSASHWEHAFRFIRADGSIANVFGRASIIRQADGKAYRMIGAIHDLSRQKELEEKLDQEIAIKAEYRESFRLIFNSSSDVLYDVNLVNDELIISDAYEKEFGYKISSHMTTAKDWTSHIHPEDQEAIIKDYLRMLASDDMEWKYSYRFLRIDNSIANILGSGIILRNASGKAYRMIGSMQDMSKQKVLEERLEQEIRLKEKQIAEAAEEAKESERSDIGKELHDNVNQLLGASRMYLNMAKQGGENTEMFLNRSAQYTMEAIEEIRKLSRGLTTDTIKNLGLCEAIGNIIKDTMEVSTLKVSFAGRSFKEHTVGNKFKMNIFRIVQEQLNNILKHAKATEVAIQLLQNKKSIRLSISENGVGFDTTLKQKGIGIANMKSRATVYYGTADFVSKPGEGCILNVTFPIEGAMLFRK